MNKVLIFDCDSTLSRVEGIDELARWRSPGILAACEGMTNDAMNGLLRVEEVFARRLDLIQPSRSEFEKLATLYWETLVPHAEETAQILRAAGWRLWILSGGFLPAVEPWAARLGVERIGAVPVHFDADGNYLDFDREFPTTRSGGKPEWIRKHRQEVARPNRFVMVGDGSSDLETRPEVDLFVGFGGVVVREKVKSGAEVFLNNLAELPAVLENRDWGTE
jgi:phosphoserine phosphatase